MVSTNLKNTRKIGSFPQVGMKKKILEITTQGYIHLFWMFKDRSETYQSKINDPDLSTKLVESSHSIPLKPTHQHKRIHFWDEIFSNQKELHPSPSTLVHFYDGKQLESFIRMTCCRSLCSAASSHNVMGGLVPKRFGKEVKISPALNGWAKHTKPHLCRM